MSETNKKTGNAAIAYGDVKVNEKEIKLDQANYGLSINEVSHLAGMEIKVEGYQIVLDDKTGKILRVKDNRTLSEIIDDERKSKIMKAMKKKDREEIEH